MVGIAVWPLLPGMQEMQDKLKACAALHSPAQAVLGVLVVCCEDMRDTLEAERQGRGQAR